MTSATVSCVIAGVSASAEVFEGGNQWPCVDLRPLSKGSIRQTPDSSKMELHTELDCCPLSVNWATLALDYFQLPVCSPNSHVAKVIEESSVLWKVYMSWYTTAGGWVVPNMNILHKSLCLLDGHFYIRHRVLYNYIRDVDYSFQRHSDQFSII